jgi:hypothetical protein
VVSISLHEPLSAKHRGEFRPQDLHGDLAFVLEVLGEVHGGHAAGPEFVLDGVTAGQRALQSLDRAIHRQS